MRKVSNRRSFRIYRWILRRRERERRERRYIRISRVISIANKCKREYLSSDILSLSIDGPRLQLDNLLCLGPDTSLGPSARRFLCCARLRTTQALRREERRYILLCRTQAMWFVYWNVLQLNDKQWKIVPKQKRSLFRPLTHPQPTCPVEFEKAKTIINLNDLNSTRQECARAINNIAINFLWHMIHAITRSVLLMRIQNSCIWVRIYWSCIHV